MSEAVAKPKHLQFVRQDFTALAISFRNQAITARRSQTIAWAVCVVERYPSRRSFGLAFSHWSNALNKLAIRASWPMMFC